MEAGNRLHRDSVDHPVHPEFEPVHRRVVDRSHRIVADVHQTLDDPYATAPSDEPRRQCGLGQRAVNEVWSPIRDESIERTNDLPSPGTGTDREQAMLGDVRKRVGVVPAKDVGDLVREIGMIEHPKIRVELVLCSARGPEPVDDVEDVCHLRAPYSRRGVVGSCPRGGTRHGVVAERTSIHRTAGREDAGWRGEAQTGWWRTPPPSPTRTPA